MGAENIAEMATHFDANEKFPILYFRSSISSCVFFRSKNPAILKSKPMVLNSILVYFSLNEWMHSCVIINFII